MGLSRNKFTVQVQQTRALPILVKMEGLAFQMLMMKSYAYAQMNMAESFVKSFLQPQVGLSLA